MTYAQRLFLRPVRHADAAGPYLHWMNNPDVVKYTESRFRSYSEEQLRQYIAATNRNPDLVFRAIALRHSGRHIGNIKLGPIDRNHGFGDVGILLGATDCWGHGYATESIELLAEEARSSSALHKLTAGCYAEHTAAIRAFEKAGFQREGIRPSQYRFEGRYVDLVYLGRLL